MLRLLIGILIGLVFVRAIARDETLRILTYVEGYLRDSVETWNPQPQANTTNEKNELCTIYLLREPDTRRLA